MRGERIGRVYLLRGLSTVHVVRGVAHMYTDVIAHTQPIEYGLRCRKDDTQRALWIRLSDHEKTYRALDVGDSPTSPLRPHPT